MRTKSYDGFMLPINADSWSQIDRKVRNEIRKAQHSGLTATHASLKDCLDCILPNRFEHGKYDFNKGNHRAFAVQVRGQELGRVLCDFAEPLIVYRCACSNREGKRLNVNSLLLWSVVTEFSGSVYRYLVLGFSSIPSIQHFKEQFGVLRFLVPAHFWDFLPSHKEEVRAYVIFEKRTTTHS